MPGPATRYQRCPHWAKNDATLVHTPCCVWLSFLDTPHSYRGSPNPKAATESRLLRLWNARRNTAHGFGGNAETLADHRGRLPADVVLLPMVYLLNLLSNCEGLLNRIANTDS